MLPYFQKELKGISIIAVQDIFSVSASCTSFYIITKTHNTATAVFQESYSLKSMIACCIPGSSPISSVTSVKLEVLCDDSSKLVVLHYLSGDPLQANSIIQDFKARLQAYGKCPQDNHYFFSKALISESHAYVELPSSKAQSFQSPRNVDIHKILATSAHGYRQQLEHFISDCRENISDDTFRRIDNFIDNISKDIGRNYPYDGFTLQYCKSVVEKYIFPKLYPAFLTFYREKNREIDGQFIAQKQKFQMLSAEQLLEALQVSKKYLLEGTESPYGEARTVFSRFSRLSTPLDKINCLIATVACIKANVVDYWKGSLEIQAMDDELPILMFLLLTCEIASPQAELQILLLYIGDKLENENRIVVNFSSAASYIACYFHS